MIVAGSWHHSIYRDQIVTVGEMINLRSLMNLHGEPAKYLRTQGRTFDNVCGLPPCYLTIPELGAILFVTRNYHQDPIFHIIDLATGKETRINGPYADFGGHIGSGRPNGQPYTDFVERADSNRIVVASAYPGAKKRYYLDLAGKRLERVVYDELDGQGRIKKTTVYIDGKLVEGK
jgi:hypothetical protein